MTDIDQIHNTQPWCWEPDHPQYIEGRLYLTRDQWDTICAVTTYDDEKWSCHPHLAWGIPVEVIDRGAEPIRLPSGKLLVYSKFHDDLLIFDPPATLGLPLTATRVPGASSLMERGGSLASSPPSPEECSFVDSSWIVRVLRNLRKIVKTAWKS